MATSSLEIVVGLRDQASGPLGGLRRALGGIGQIAGGILGAQAISGVINGIKGMATEALDAVSSYERLGASMEALAAREMRAADDTLSMEDALKAAAPRAQELLKWVEQLAIKSPFDQEGVAQALKTAMAYGFTSEQAQKLTEVSIDFVAATGGTSEQMNSIALALGQMQAKGKVSGQELLQLTNAGVGVNAILEGMGFTLKDVEKGLVSSDAFFQAFTQTMEDDFGGAAERQSGTWAGLLSTLGDVKKIGLREFFGGVFKAVQPLVAKLAEWLQGPGLEQLRIWGERVGVLASKFVGFVQALMGGGIRGAMASFFPPELLARISGLIALLQPLWAAVQNLVAAFVESGPEIRAAAEEIWQGIQNAFSENGPVIIDNLTDIINSLAELWRDHGDQIIAIVSTAIQWIIQALVGGTTFLTGLVSGFLKGLTGDWDGAWNTIKRSTETFASGIMRLMGTTLEQVRQTWARNLEMLVAIVILLWQKMFNAGKNIVNGLKSGIQSQWASLVSWLKAQIAALVAMINAALKIRSPSGVFAEIGAQMMAGMAQGIQGAMGMPQLALAKATPGGVSGSGGGSGLYIGSQNITIFNGSDMDEILETIQAANARSARVGSAGYAG